MDIIDENKYNEIRNILSGCKNIDDAKYIMKIYLRNNPESKKIAMSVLFGQTYEDNISSNILHEIMEKINNCSNYDMCLKLINEYYPNDNNNILKLKTLKKMLSKKEIIKNNNSLHNINPHQNYLININLNCSNKQNKKIKQNEILKECPHCSKPYIGNENLTHVICGYNNSHQGFDWEGCTKDWCFSCGKKLCKSWIENKLYLEINRTHNFECCKKHASTNCELYGNYCQCNNKYVNRKKC
jgi:hypothetical protein